MFEVITRTQPDDYQSLEILKEAYTKLGRMDDTLRTARKLAEAYFNVGSYALAMQECEMLLGQDPNAPEVLAMLGDIESRLQAAGQTLSGGLKHWVNRQSSRRRRRRAGTARSEGTRELQFARTRGRAAGEVSDRPANFPGRNGQRGTGKGAAAEQEPAGADAGGFAAGGVVRGGHRQDRPVLSRR